MIILRAVSAEQTQDQKSKRMMMTEELQTYLLNYCGSLLLREEKRALIRSGFLNDREQSMRKLALTNPAVEDLYGFTDEKTNALATLGKEELKRAVAERLLKDHGPEIITTCPRCEKLARTPLAKQCRHCGFDWH